VTNVQIRLELPDDEIGVRETNEQAFGAPTEAALVDRLRGSPDSISLVAAIADRIVGHILFTPISLEPAARVRVAGLPPLMTNAGDVIDPDDGRVWRWEVQVGP
jgi:putative acetyltransferase